MAYKTNVDINLKCTNVKNKDLNHYTIEIFLEQCLNSVTQRTIEISLNGATVKLWENIIP